jgi:ribosome maturation factor RimP
MPSGRPQSEARPQLIDLLTPVVASVGLDLEDLSVQTVGRRSVLRLIVDGDEGVDLDAVASVSRAISDALDEDDTTDVLGGAYLLEVSSPGVDRPLTEPRHWRRATGRLVKVSIKGNPTTARIVSVQADGVTLELENGPHEVGWAALGPGKVQIEFNRSGADGATAEDAEHDAAEGG